MLIPSFLLIFTAPVSFYFLSKLIGFYFRKRKLEISRLKKIERLVYSVWKSRTRILTQLIFFLFLGCFQEMHLFATIQLLNFNNITTFERINFAFSVFWIFVEIIILLYVIQSYTKSNNQIFSDKKKTILKRGFILIKAKSDNQNRYPFLFGNLLRDDEYGMSFIFLKSLKNLFCQPSMLCSQMTWKLPLPYC